jgi:hypothetical protein
MAESWLGEPGILLPDVTPELEKSVELALADLSRDGHAAPERILTLLVRLAGRHGLDLPDEECLEADMAVLAGWPAADFERAYWRIWEAWTYRRFPTLGDFLKAAGGLDASRRTALTELQLRLQTLRLRERWTEEARAASRRASERAEEERKARRLERETREREAGDRSAAGQALADQVEGEGAAKNPPLPLEPPGQDLDQVGQGCSTEPAQQIAELVRRRQDAPARSEIVVPAPLGTHETDAGAEAARTNGIPEHGDPESPVEAEAAEMADERLADLPELGILGGGAGGACRVIGGSVVAEIAKAQRQAGEAGGARLLHSKHGPGADSEPLRQVLLTEIEDVAPERPDGQGIARQSGRSFRRSAHDATILSRISSKPSPSIRIGIGRKLSDTGMTALTKRRICCGTEPHSRERTALAGEISGLTTSTRWPCSAAWNARSTRTGSTAWITSVLPSGPSLSSRLPFMALSPWGRRL